MQLHQTNYGIIDDAFEFIGDAIPYPLFAQLLDGSDALRFYKDLVDDGYGTKHPPGRAIILRLFKKDLRGSGNDLVVLLVGVGHVGGGDLPSSKLTKAPMHSISSGERILELQAPVVMGILNCTPDSFYIGSRVQQLEQGLRFAEEQILQGAAILDLGGQSTRPGSARVSAAEERDRVIPLLTAIRKKYPAVFLSVDTFYGDVAQAAIDAGADLINDISAGKIDPTLQAVVAHSGLPYVLMHMQGTPQTMQSLTDYADVTESVFRFFEEEIDVCKQAGIGQLILDPGIGFAKTIAQNFQLLHNLSQFKQFPYPLLIGVSRKSMIYKTLDVDPLLALNGTTALHMYALMQGANILRAHDVRPAWETSRLFMAVQGSN